MTDIFWNDLTINFEQTFYLGYSFWWLWALYVQFEWVILLAPLLDPQVLWQEALKEQSIDDYFWMIDKIYSKLYRGVDKKKYKKLFYYSSSGLCR